MGGYIRRAREARGLSQAQLAKALGYAGGSNIAAVETGRTGIPLERFDAFADALGVAREDFWKAAREAAGSAPSSTNPTVLLRQGYIPPDVAEELSSRKYSEKFWDAVRSLLSLEDAAPRKRRPYPSAPDDSSSAIPAAAESGAQKKKKR